MFSIILCKTHYWPIITTVWLFLTYIISYTIAVLKKDVDPIFPYISDTGALPVESCIFGQLLNIGALLMFICVFIRHKLVEIYLKESYRPKLLIFNKVSFAFGFLGCFGVSLVANFQETSNMAMHVVGAFMAFILGSVYFIFQTIISWKTEISKLTKYVRTIITLSVVAFYLGTVVTGQEAFSEFHGEDVLKWKKDDGGYDFHLASTFCEWLMAIALSLYILTFTNEFKQLNFEGIIFHKIQ